MMGGPPGMMGGPVQSRQGYRSDLIHSNTPKRLRMSGEYDNSQYGMPNLNTSGHMYSYGSMSLPPRTWSNGQQTRGHVSYAPQATGYLPSGLMASGQIARLTTPQVVMLVVQTGRVMMLETMTAVSLIHPRMTSRPAQTHWTRLGMLWCVCCTQLFTNWLQSQCLPLGMEALRGPMNLSRVPSY